MMVWSVADRFGFDVVDSPIRRVRYWYRGAAALAKHEQGVINGGH